MEERERTISHVQDSTVGGRRGEAGRPLSTDRSGGEQRRIYRGDVSEDAAKVVAGVATSMVMVTVMESTAMTEGVLEDTPVMQGLGPDRVQDTPRAAAGRGPGVPPP